MAQFFPRRLDGVYRQTRDLVVHEYWFHPVRFFTILTLIVALLGVTAYFQPIKAAISLYSDQNKLEKRYPNFQTLAEQRKVKQSSDQYFVGEEQVVASSTPVEIVLAGAAQSAEVIVDNAHADISNKPTVFKNSVDIKKADGKAKLTQKNTNGSAGLYQIKAKDKKTGAVTAEDTVAWGVLAFNPDYSIYPTNTTAALALAVLDDRGKMICDASMTIEITDPLGKKTILSTENKLILVNESCLVYGPTSEPDYVANYFTRAEGDYQVTVTARVGRGVRTLHDQLSVKANQPFYLQRVGATRTFPNADYAHKINFQPTVDGNYRLTETVPAEFIISDTTAKVTTVGEVKELVWQVDAKTKENQTLMFGYKGPLISPHLYNLGPATVEKVEANVQKDTDLSKPTGFTEPRQWQIASDAPSTVNWDGSASANWSDGANWSTNAIPQAGDNLVFPASVSNKSNTNDLGENYRFNSITFNDSGYTLSGNTIILGQGQGTNALILPGITDAVASGGNTIALPIRLDATRLITVSNSGETLTISGAITGVGGISKEGVGTLVLSGGNTYGGVTKVNVGILNARHATALGTIATGTEVVGEAALELQGTIAVGREALTLRGYGSSSNGALRNIANNNSWAGLITIAGTTEISADSSTTLTLSGGVTGTFNLNLDGAGNITFEKAPIAIAGGLLTKNGAGTLTYNFPNTYTGLTTVNAGTLTYGVDNAILSGGITVNGGTVDIATFSDMVGTVTLGTLAGGSGTITGSTGVLSSATYTVYAGTISAIIAGDAGALTKSTPGTVTLTKANLFTGAVTVSVGNLKIQNSTALGTIDGITTVTSGATLQVDGTGLSVPEFITISGVGLLNQGAIWNSTGSNTITGLVTMAAASTVKADVSTTITYATGGFTGTFGLTVNGDGDTTISGPINISSGTLSKNGPGTLTLSAFNPYTGATTINTGTLTLNSNGAITMSASISINSNGKLIVDNSSVVTDRIGDAVAVSMNGGSWDFYGSSSTNTLATAGTLTMASGKNSITVFAGTGGYTIMRFASFSRTAGARGLIRGASLGATPAANVATILFTTAPTLIGDDGVAGTAAVSVLQGVFGDNSTSGTGTDMVTYGRGNNNGLRLLNGAGFSNEYTTDFSVTNANIKITAATAAVTSQINSLILNSGASITNPGSAQTITFMSGNILNLQASGSIDGANTTFAAGAVEFSISTPQSLTWSSLITTTGGLTKGGTGTLTFSTAKTYTGLTAVNDGTLLYGINDAISSGAVTVNDATLDIDIYNDTVGAVIVQGGIITGTSGVLTATSYDLRAATINAILGGSGTTTISNTNERVDAATTMSKDNTYTGSTAISSGILKLGAAGGGTNTPLGTTAGTTTITSGAMLDLNGFSLGTAEAISVNGTGVAVMGAITNTSSTTATYTGALTLAGASRLEATYGKIIVSGGISGASALTVGGFFDVDLSGVLSTITTVTKDGFGIYTPSNGNSSYTGTTTISAGTLKLGAVSVGGTNSPLGTNGGATAVTAGAMLDLNGYSLGIAEALTNLNGVGGGSGDFAPGALINSSGSAVAWTGTITLGVASTIKANSGAITLSAVTGAFALTLGGTGTGTVSGVFGAGAATLTKIDTGTWTMSGVNTYTGASTVYQGTIKFGVADAAGGGPLGTAAAGTTVYSGAVIDMNGFSASALAEGLTINGFGIADGGALVNNSAGGVTYLGNRTLSSDSRFTNSGAGALTLSGTSTGVFETRLGGAGNFTLSGAWGASAATVWKDGAGTATASVAQGWTGNTTVIAGTLQDGALNGLSSGNVIVAGGTFDLSSNNADTVGAVWLIDGIISTTGGAAAILTGTSYTVESGTISGVIAGAVALTKNTAGTAAITAAITTSSTLTVNAGTMTLSGSGSAVSVTAVTINLSGILTLDNSTTNVASRLLDTIVLTMNGGDFNFIGKDSTTVTETIGQLLFSTGHNTVTIDPKAGSGGLGTALTVANNPGFNRTAGATVLFRGTSFGSAQAAGISSLLFTTAPTLSGAGGGANSTTVNVIKGAFGDTSLTGSGSDMVTYNVGDTTGLRLLNGAGHTGEYAANLATTNANVKLTADAAATTNNNNSLILNGFGVTNASVTMPMANGASLAGNILMNSATTIAGANTVLGITTNELDILATANGTISATIGTATTGSVALSGSGNMTLSGAAAYTSTTFINNSSTLTEGASNVISTGGVTVVGGTFNLNGNSDSVGAITMTAGTAASGAGTLTTTGTFATVANANKSSFVTGTFAVPAAAVFNIADGLVEDDTVVSATITGAGTSLTKSTGTGVVVLGGSNTNAGTNVVSAGTIKLGVAGGVTNTPLGTTGGATTVASGAALDLNGYTLGTAEGLTISGTGVSTKGALLNTMSTAVTYSGLILLGAAATIQSDYGTMTISNTGSMTGTGFALTLRGAGDGSIATQVNTSTAGSRVKNDLGTWTISGDGNYTGVTTITLGVLKLGAAGGATNNPLGTIGTNTTIASGAMLDLNGFTLGTAEPLSTAGTGIANAGAVTTSSGSSTSYSGAITMTAASRITNYGAGAFNASGAIAGNFALTTVNAPGNITLGTGVWSGTGTLIKEGWGVTILSGQNTMTGAMTVSTGTLQLGASGGGTNSPVGTNAGGVTVSAGAVFDTSTFQINNAGVGSNEGLTLNGSGLKNGGALISNSASTNTFSTIALGSAARIINTGAGTLTFSGAPSGAFNFVVGGSGNTTFSTAFPANATTITKWDAGTLTVTGTNLNTGLIQVNGGTFKYAATTTLVGPNLVVDGGTFDFNGNADTIGTVTLRSGTITDSNGTPSALTGATAYTVYSGTISAILAGAVPLNKSTGGTVIMTKVNTYSALTTISAGTLQYGASNIIADAQSVTVNGGTLDIQANTDTFATLTLTSGSVIGAGTITGTAAPAYAVASGSISAILAGAVNLTKTTAGTVVLSGINTYTGITTISGGILSVGTIGNGSAGGSNIGNASAAAANIVFNTGTGTLQYTGTTSSTDRAYTTTTAITTIFDVTNPAAILTWGGAGTVTTALITKAGSGTLKFSVAQGHTGLTSALAGTLQYGIADTLSTGAVTVTNGTLDLNNFSDSVGTLTLTNGGQIVDTGGSTAVLTSTATFALQSGKVSTRLGSAVAAGISKTTTDRVILSGDNTFTSTSIALSAGYLNLQSNNALGAAATSFTGTGLAVTSGAVLELQGTITIPSTKLITPSGTGINSIGAVRNVADSNTIQANIALGATGTRINSDSGALTFPTVSGNTFNLIVGGAGNVTVTGIISTTSGTLTKDGAGTLTLQGNNSYTGTTTISAGVVNIRHAAGLGTTAAGTTVASGAALQLQGTITVGAETLGLSGTGVASDGALRNITDNNTYQGTITLNTTSSIGSDAGTLTLSGTITGGASIGLTKAGAGGVSVSNTVTVGGDLTISAGTLTAASNTITVSGNWANSGTFTAGSSTVALNGSATQTLSGTMTTTSAFNNLTVTNASGTNAADCERTSFVASIDFNAAATVSTNLVFTTASTRVEFNDSSTYTFNNINWNGQASGTKIYFRNSVADSGSWLLKVTGTQTAVSFINVSRSDASVVGGNAIVANDGTNVDCLNNTNWTFPSSNTAPNAPSSLAQMRTNDAALATGDWTNETSVKFTATASDTDNPDTLKLCVEAVAIASSFANTDTGCGTLTAYSGTPITVTVTLSGLVTGTEYKWQARVKDTADAVSTWTDYAANGASRDVGVDTSACSIATIYDGTSVGVDSGYNDSSVTALSGNWDAFTCTVSGLQKYEYSIGVTAGGTTIKGWTDNSTTTSVTSTSLTLHTNEHYFVNVRATDNAGNVSTVASSNGQQVLPSLSFSMGANTITFSNLNSTNNRLDTKTVSLTTSTNAYGGYVIRQYAGGLLTDGTNNIPMFSAGSYAAPAAWGAGQCSGTSCGYGYTSNDTTIQGSNLFSSGTLYAPFSQTPAGDIVADHTTAIDGSSGAVTDEAFTITHKVAVTALQAAKTYQATIYYIVTGTF